MNPHQANPKQRKHTFRNAKVAQVSNLLCRRLPVGRAREPFGACGLETRDTTQRGKPQTGRVRTRSRDCLKCLVLQAGEAVKKLAKGSKLEIPHANNQQLPLSDIFDFRFIHTFGGLPEGSRGSSVASVARPPECQFNSHSTPRGVAEPAWKSSEHF